MQRAVDGDNVTLGKHLLEVLDTAAADLLLDLGLQGLVVVVEELLALEGLETAEHTLTDTADGDGTDDLALQVVLVLGDGSDVPLAADDLLVGRDEVADEGQDGQDNVLRDGGDVAAGDLGDGDTAVGLVGGVQVDVVRADTGGDGELELLGLGQTLSSQVTGVEAADSRLAIHSKLRRSQLRRTYGVVIMTSASTSSRSKTESGPSLSEVVTRVWPWSSSHLRRPSSFSVVPSRPGCCLACSPPWRSRGSAIEFEAKHADHHDPRCREPVDGRLTSYRHIKTLTCRLAVAVSVRAWANGEGAFQQARCKGALADSRDEAGRLS